MWKYQQYKSFRKSQNKFASDWFVKKNFTVQDKYPFILRHNSQWKENIILDSVANFIEKVKNEYEIKKVPFPLHKYVHHGLSSQAMLFNLLGESTLKHDTHFFSSLFAYKDVCIDGSSELLFEYSDRKTFNELQRQPTSFDFAIKNNKGKNIFLEAKYVETEFGKCSTIEGGECDGLNPINDVDSCYLTHCGRNYWELMIKYGLSEPYKNSLICPFVIYYQFYRELLFAAKNNGYYVILIDKRNPAFMKTDGVNERGLIPILTSRISEEMKSIIKIVFIQDVVELLEKSNYSWVEEFKEKYGLTK
ncbi:MAG: hypothetical protein LBQ22_05925 [Bacteroidales bacterium]|jgi:hypothetical protein|nr:hypothetical protein [Bacteroidales bacterium]